MKNPDKVRTGEVTADTNPHLVSNKVAHPNGGEYISHTMFYTQRQIDKMEKAAGKKVTQIEGDTVYGIHANLTLNDQHEVIVKTTKPMSETKNPYFGKTILDKQASVTNAAREARAMSKTAQQSVTKDEPAKPRCLPDVSFVDVSEDQLDVSLD